MESLVLDCYDRFAWLLRTGLRYSSDSLIAARLREYRAGRKEKA